MRRKLSKIAGVALLVALSLSCFADGRPPVAHAGILDLRNQDLFGRSFSMDGEWGFFWNRLLPPDSLSSAVPDYVPFPVLWKDLRVKGQKIPSQGYGTYTLTILLPAKRPRIGMEIPEAYSSMKLYVNGVVQVQDGEPATTEEKATPFFANKTIALPNGEHDTLVLVLQIANFWHVRGGVYKSILIGDKDELFLKKNRDAAYDFTLAGCLFMGGLFFFGLFMFGRNDKTILYFSLFCMLYSYRMVGTSHYALHALFSDLNWFITLRIEYLALFLSVALFAAYTRKLYPDDSHHLAMQFMIWVCLAYSALVLFTPTLVFTRALVTFLLLMFLYIGYATYIYIQAARHRRSGSLFGLLSTAVMLSIFLLSNLNYFGIIPDLRLILFIGYISFFFLQSLALSHRFAQSFRQATEQAQQGLRSKSEFLSTMSHEIRTPLNAVIGMTHLLLNHDPREDQKEDLDVLLFSANNLLSIVNNILDYNKIEEGKIEFENIPMDISSIAHHIAAGLKNTADEKGIHLLTDIDSRLYKNVMGDPTRTSQVMNNLMHNAVKFTREGYVKLSIIVDSLQPDLVTITVKVTDTGIGIPAEKQGIIFDRFTQADSSTSRSFGGTGLGLAITRKILELQGVGLQLRSEPGKGSEFYFTQTFPFMKEKDTAKEARDPLPVNDHKQLLRGIHLLLVEDNPLNVLVAQTMLENKGAIVDIASNGEEALELLEPDRHQLILMDLHMPVMDGYEATILFRQRGETLPIIALTASTPKEVENGAFAAGLNDIVVKPFNPDELYRLILKHVHKVPQ